MGTLAGPNSFQYLYLPLDRSHRALARREAGVAMREAQSYT